MMSNNNDGWSLVNAFFNIYLKTLNQSATENTITASRINIFVVTVKFLANLLVAIVNINIVSKFAEFIKLKVVSGSTATPTFNATKFNVILNSIAKDCRYYCHLRLTQNKFLSKALITRKFRN